MKINVCVPSKRAPMNLFTVQCLFDLLKDNKEHDIEVLIDTSFGIDASRNKLVEKSKDADYLLFCDTDTKFNSNSLRKLLEHKKDIISGLYFSRGFPYNPMAFHKKNEEGYQWHTGKLEGLLEVDSIGFGFVLIKKSMFDALKKPYFRYKYKGSSKSEDMYLCEKLKKAKFKIYVDCDVKIGHWTERAITESDWRKVRPCMIG